MPFTLYDYVDQDGTSVVASWLQGRDTKTQARFRAKLDAIKMAWPTLPNMVTDTRVRTIKEVVLNMKGVGAFRIFLCRGPADPESELTLLLGGQERDRKYVGSGTPERAEELRQELLQDVKHRRRKHG